LARKPVPGRGQPAEPAIDETAWLEHQSGAALFGSERSDTRIFAQAIAAGFGRVKSFGNADIKVGVTTM
jgi:hypothetical protein